MPQSPVIFDRRLLRRRRSRAVALGPATFLLDHVGRDLAERLATILRKFEVVADLGTPGDAVRRVLSGSVAKIIAADVVPVDGPGLAIVADLEALPFRDASLDLVVSGLALQFVNDLPGTLAQIR